MDKEQLKQLKYLKSEIKILQRQIEDIETITTKDSVKGSLSEHPYIETHFKIEGVDYKSYNRKVKRLQRKLSRRMEELIDLVEETNEYIESIDDSLIRQIIALRYINGLTWDQVAASIGGNNTAESVRKAAERFLK